MYNCAKRVVKNVLYPLSRGCVAAANPSRFSVRFRHSLCSVAATGIPGAVVPEYPRGYLNENLNSRLALEATESPLTSRVHRLYTIGSKYVPYAQNLIEGILMLDEDKIWNLVHELVMGRSLFPVDSPEYAEFEHVVRLGGFSLALSALSWKEHYSLSHNETQNVGILDVEVEGSAEDSLESSSKYHLPASMIPAWLSVYMLSTMVKTRADAARSFDFCLMQLDTNTKTVTATLLLLSMCSLVRYNIINQIPALLNTFSDTVISFLQTEAVETTLGTPTTNPSYPSWPIMVFQCNVLLNLLSQLPYSLVLGKATTRFLRQMLDAGISLETDTAKKLLSANFATQEMAALVTQMLRNQTGQLVETHCPDVYVSLAQFYSKRRDLIRAVEVMKETRNYDINKHLRTYLRAFRDTAYALRYIKEVRGGVSGNDSFEEQVKDESSRPVYLSLLRSAAQCRSLSTENFLDMFKTIRDQLDDDKKLYTIGLIGLIRRHNFEQAKALWGEWVTNVAQLETIIGQLRRYLSERKTKFQDDEVARTVLNWDKRTELEARRKLNKLRIDSDALVLGVRAVAGPKPDSLAEAFALMEKYACKKSVITPRVINCFMNRAVSFRRPDLVFKFWDETWTHYGVSPSLGSLIILMRASRISASMNLSMQRFVPKWLRRRSSTIPLNTSFKEAVSLMLHPKYVPDFFWRNWEPWRVTRYIFRERFIYQNWPDLRTVYIPALAVRGDSATNAIDAFQEAELHQRMRDVKLSDYYHLLPDQQTFKQYVLMLGRVHRSSEIPEVLAWMKELDAIPTKLTLKVFLALWSQVGLDSPISEGWTMLPGHNTGHGGEYSKLIAWLERWVGKENVPTDGEILEAFQYINSIESKESVLY